MSKPPTWPTEKRDSIRQKDARDTANPFGVLTFLDWNHPWNAHMYDSGEKIKQSLDALVNSGAGMARQVISWDEIEQQKGVWDFSKYDQILQALEAREIRTLAVLCYNATCTGKAWNTPPDPNLFGEYVRQTVRRYKDRIKYWELWNEPDQKIYWDPQDGMQTYAALLKVVHAIVKEEDPTAMVVLGSVSAAPSLRDMYRAGVKGNFDVLNVHPFVSPLLPDALEKLRDIYDGVISTLAEFDDHAKSIWFTELGCPGVKDPQTSAGWWLGRSPSEDQQAQWVSTIFMEAQRWPGVERIFWAFLQETLHFGNDIDAFGLIRRDGSPKPAFEAYRQAVSAWVDSNTHV